MALEAGTRLGPYEILALIGAGGMGEVYKARDTRLDRTVAIKTLSPRLAADAQFRERFDREARVISQLDHPNICALYDVGEHHGRAFLVMQYLEGETLAARLAPSQDRARPDAGTPLQDSGGGRSLDRPVAIPEALQLATEIASALDAAHTAGVVHRDLKPGNVMLVTSAHHLAPQAKLLDFGVAKRVEPAPSAMDAPTVAAHTGLGFVVGTTKYLSPEQARGLAVDGRSDLFSLGVLLYEMLTGRAPFDASTATDVIVAILEREPTPLARVRPDIPPAWQRVVGRCLEKDVTRRYASARDLMLDLEKLKTDGSGSHAAAKAVPSIAVLPFVNMSADPENKYFCDGIAEDLISGLTNIEQLHVAARTSAFSFKGKCAELREIGRALNVSTVLEGSVRKAGTRLRVTAQLTNIADGYQLWSSRYDRQLADVFEIQDEISLAIVNALKVKLLGEDKAAVVKRHTDNIEAYQLYLKGRHHWHKWSADGFAKSRECMERAIQIDPDYALAYVGLADVYLAMGAVGLISYPELLPKAKSALTRALSLDPDLPEAWTLLSVTHFFEWEWTASEQAGTRAIELNPRLGHAYVARAFNSLFSGRYEGSLADAKCAVELDPLAQLWNQILILAYMARGDDQSALRQIHILVDIDAGFWWSHSLRGVLVLAAGQHDEATECFAEAVRCSGGAPYAVGYLVCSLALAGERDRAQRELAQLRERIKLHHVPGLSFALAYAGLGPADRVFEWLERSFEERDIWLMVHLLHHHQFDGLRRDPRAIDLRRRIAQCGVRLDIE